MQKEDFEIYLRELEFKYFSSQDEAEDSSGMMALISAMGRFLHAEAISFYLMIENRYSVGYCVHWMQNHAIAEEKESFKDFFVYPDLLNKIFSGKIFCIDKQHHPFIGQFEADYFERTAYHTHWLIPKRLEHSNTLGFFHIKFVAANAILEAQIQNILEQTCYRITTLWTLRQDFSKRMKHFHTQEVLLYHLELLICHFVNPSKYGFVNEAFSVFFGSHKQDMELQDVYAVHREADANQLVMDNLEVYQTKKKLVRETVLLNAAGEERVLRITRIPIIEENGKIAYLLCTGQDVTEYKHAEAKILEAKEEAERSNRVKTVFLNNMSHEIRMPLNGIIGYTDLLLNLPEENKHSEFLMAIRNEANTLHTLLNDILDLTKAEGEKLSLNNTEMHFRKEIEDAIRLSYYVAREKGLEIHLMMSQKIPRFLYGDALRMKQVCNILLSNAIKFTQAGDILVNIDLIEDRKDRVLLDFHVIDTGIGIAKENWDTIFLPFARIREGEMERLGGTGVGLTIAQRIVQLMGGTLRVDSQLGTGSNFSFEIPFGKHRDEKDIWPVFHGETVLLIDNNEVSKKVLEGYLSQFGFHIIAEAHMESVKEGFATKRWQQENVKLILLNENAGDPSFFEKSIGIPLAFISSKSLPKNIVKSCKFLKKPVFAEALLNLLNCNLIDIPLAAKKKKPEETHILIVENEMSAKIIQIILKNNGFACDIPLKSKDLEEMFRNQAYDFVLVDHSLIESPEFQQGRSLIERAKEEVGTRVVALTSYHMQYEEKKYDAMIDHFIIKPINSQELLKVIQEGKTGAG